MTIPVDGYARPKPKRYMTDIDMPWAREAPRMDAQRILERELQKLERPGVPPFMPPGAAPGAEERIRQLQRMRRQQPQQVVPDPQPPPPPGPLKSVLIRPDQMM